MREPVHTEELRGYKIEIFYDDDPLNPRTDWDHVGTMLCAHGRYNLGDVVFRDSGRLIASVYDEYFPDAEVDEYTEDMLDECPIIWLPLYLYDHSGITMRTSSFSCPWDSGQVGIIYVSRAKAAEEWPRGEDESEESWKQRAYSYLQGEVKEYDQYLTGNVYGYVITHGETDEEVESCWGFFGDYDDPGNCLEQARDAVPDEPAKPDATLIMVFHADGTVEFTRSPKLYKFFNGEGEMERISEIRKDVDKYFIEWLKGPNAGWAHTYGISLALGLISTCPEASLVMRFDTYEDAVEHEIAVLNAMRREGVTFV